MSKLRFLTAGESHGPVLVMILEGMPAGLRLSKSVIDRELKRRQKSFGSGIRMEIEDDRCTIMSGVLDGQTTGAPIAIQIENLDHTHWQDKLTPARTTPRPGHADLTAALKYGYGDLRPGLERASARETAARVAAGSLCKHLLNQFGIRIGGYVFSIGEYFCKLKGVPEEERLVIAEQNDLRCPDEVAYTKMRSAIEQAQRQGETLGGVIEVLGIDLPPGLGSHVHWDRKMDGRLAQAVMSIPAIKGFEIGPAFQNSQLPGSQVQDGIYLVGDQIKRFSNSAGGLEGGMTNGETLIVRAAFKPIPTTIKSQPSVNLATGKEQEMVYERSDICPISRAVVVVEAMVAFVCAQSLLDKLGGDSLKEMQARYQQLKQLKLEDTIMDGKSKVWWS